METRIGPDDRHPGTLVLTVDGVPQSTLEPADPTFLIDEYCRHLGFLVDAMAPPGRPVRVLHLGAGALVMARYVAATRRRSYQQAVDIDADLVELVRREAPLGKGVKVKIRIGDAREVLEAAPDGCYDLVIGDVFRGFTTPAGVTSVEFMREAHRVLAPEGFYAANLVDGKGLRFSKGVAAAAAATFRDSAILADTSVLNGNRHGNLVLYAAKESLPIVEIRRRAAGTPFPCRVVHGADFDRFLGGVPATVDATAGASPHPPKRFL